MGAFSKFIAVSRETSTWCDLENAFKKRPTPELWLHLAKQINGDICVYCDGLILPLIITQRDSFLAMLAMAIPI